MMQLGPPIPSVCLTPLRETVALPKPEIATITTCAMVSVLRYRLKKSGESDPKLPLRPLTPDSAKVKADGKVADVEGAAKVIMF